MKTTRIRAIIAQTPPSPPISHTHIIADTTGIQAALDGKQASGSYAASTHTHAQSDVTNLVSDLAGKAASTEWLCLGADNILTHPRSDRRKATS